MKQFTGRTAVITGAGSGFGLEASRIAARRGMNVVMADVQADALDARRGRDRRPRRAGAGAAGRRRKAAEVEALGAGGRESASARRTSSSTTPASAPAA